MHKTLSKVPNYIKIGLVTQKTKLKKENYKMPDINMQKKIELLSQKVSEYFNIEQIPISFDDTILDDSRLNIKPKFSIVTNRKFKMIILNVLKL